MSLNLVLKSILIEERGNIPLKPVCTSSQSYAPGDVFLAIQGSSFDSHSVLESLKRPAGLILEKKEKLPLNYQGPYILVSSTRKALDLIFHAVYKYPSQKLFCVGITGTNGKTTVSHMVEKILCAGGVSTAVIGTINHHFQEHVWQTHLTSPGSQELYSRLSEFVDLGAQGLAIEVSSHALDQSRMASMEFDVAIFTNLSHDHLDYHGSLENYFQAKRKLFTDILPHSNKKKKYAIINADDPYGARISLPSSISTLSYGVGQGDLRASQIQQSFSGQKFCMTYQGETWSVETPMVGLFNVYNTLAALAVALIKGLDLKNILDELKNFKGVPGRMERVENNQNKHVFVDYSHTPDALKNVLLTLKDFEEEGRIITVFGCGGDRDKEKRPRMGEIACQLSDYVVLTSDNPRTEDPKKILQEIEKGCVEFKNYSLEEDRKLAIQKALDFAKSGDAVLIAGKGHEDYQILGEKTLPFHDATVAKLYLDGEG